MLFTSLLDIFIFFDLSPSSTIRAYLPSTRVTVKVAANWRNYQVIVEMCTPSTALLF